MKLFLKEHLILIIVQCIQLIIIFSIFGLDGGHQWSIFLYAAFLGFFFLMIYLCFQYITRREFYQRLEKKLATLDESLQVLNHAPISIALNELLKSQYYLYMDKINNIERSKSDHLKFIDLWVHQMKTPLSVIELTAQNLDEPESSSIREETERMKNGLHTVLYMARLRTISEDFHIKPVSLENIVHDVNQENKRFYIRNKVYPKVEKITDGLFVETDEKWLYFIVSQLIHNAVKYSAGISQKIVISLYERGKFAILEIKDFGIGIPVADQKRIFNAFFTGENGRKYRESTGMGLYLVKEVTDYLGHKVEIESEVGKGTIFRVIFPPMQNLTRM